MSTASGDRPLSRMVVFTAHAIPYIIVIAVAARIASLLKLIPIQLWVVFELALLASFVALFIHRVNARLYLRCIQDSPLNPELSVRQNKAFLRFEHRTFRQWLIIWTACVACSMASDYMHGLLSVMLYLPMDVLLFSQMWGFWIHHRLQPWCPYYRGWDEGGDPELVPDPDPAETKTA